MVRETVDDVYVSPYLIPKTGIPRVSNHRCYPYVCHCYGTRIHIYVYVSFSLSPIEITSPSNTNPQFPWKTK